MTISSISSSSSYLNQLSTLRNRTTSSETEKSNSKEKPSLAELVSKLDTDASGSLEQTEVQSLTEMISEATGVSVDLTEFLNTYDTDADGALNEDEAVAALEANRPEGPPPGGMGAMQGSGGPDYSQMFSDADTDGDSSISATEAESLADIISNATGTTLKAEDLIATYDADDDGVLSEEETATALEANRPEGPPPGGMGAMQGSGGPDYAQMFSDADTDGDSSISATEAESLADIISNATGTTLKAEDLIATYDADDDGVLSEEETATALEANRPEGPPPSQGNMTAASEDSDAVTAAAIDNYLKMAALGMEQDQASNDLFSMLTGSNSSVDNVA